MNYAQNIKADMSEVMNYAQSVDRSEVMNYAKKKKKKKKG